jgi:hypothetical protein
LSDCVHCRESVGIDQTIFGCLDPVPLSEFLEPRRGLGVVASIPVLGVDHEYTVPVDNLEIDYLWIPALFHAFAIFVDGCGVMILQAVTHCRI